MIVTTSSTRLRRVHHRRTGEVVPPRTQSPKPVKPAGTHQLHPDEESALWKGMDLPRRPNRWRDSRTGERCFAVLATAIDTTRLPRHWSLCCYFCLGLLVVVSLIFGDEVIMFWTLGLRRGISCPDGKLAGERAQKVCIAENTVSKVPMPCTNASNLANLIDCKSTYWRQMYVNNHWETYARSPLIPNVLGRGRWSGIVFERVKHVKDPGDVMPDYEFNRKQLRILNEMLGRNGHVALDVRLATKLNSDPNVLLDDSGRMHIIDFNLMPVWLRGQGVDEHAQKLPLFDNIYGTYSLLDWVVEGGMESDLVRRALTREKGGTRRGLGKGPPLRGGTAAV